MKIARNRFLSMLCAVALLVSVVLPGMSMVARGADDHECQFGNYEYQGDAKKITPPTTAAELIEKAGTSVLVSFGTSGFDPLPNAAYGDTMVSDADAWNGSAAKFSYAARVAGGIDQNGLNALLFTGNGKFELLTDAFKKDGSYDGLCLKQIFPDELQANSGKGYILYKADNVHAWAATDESSNYIRMLGWALNINLTPYKDILAGQTVDVYLSMKIEGVVDGSDANNYPVYYIDGIIITTSDALEGGPTMDYGTMVGTCIYCGATDVKPASDKHVKVFTSNDFHFADNRVGDSKVADPDSVMGTAVKRESYVNGSVRQNLILKDANKIDIGFYTSYTMITSIAGDEVKANQGYQLYKYSFESFGDISGDYVMFWFSDWQLQSNTLLAAMKTYNGKAIDFYLSMKVTGVVDGSDPENYPVYYIDRVIVVERCANITTTATHHTCSTCDLAEAHTYENGKCDCGFVGMPHSLKLNSILKVFLDVPTALIGNGAYLQVDGEKVTAAGESITKDDGFAYTRYALDVMAQNMTKTIDVKLCAANGTVIASRPFDLATYVSEVEALGNDTTTKLAKATLAYCQHAAYVKHGGDTAPEAPAALPENAFDNYKINKNTTVADIRCNAYLDEACDLQLLLPVKYADCIVTVDGGEATTVSTLNQKTVNGTLYYVYAVAEILPQDYDGVHTFVVMNGIDEIYRNEISVLAYIGHCIDTDAGTEAQSNLMKTMYHYFAAAEAYLAAQG